MKLKLFLTFLIATTFSYAQITLTRHSGTPIVNGQIIAFNSVVLPAAEMDFYVRNTSTTTSTNVKILCESLVNNDGTGFELCFGNECLSYVEQGETYPTTAPVTLAPNGVNGNFDHFLNTTAGTGPYPKDYVFKFYQINGTGNEISNSITMTYRFDPNLSVDDIQQLESSGVILKSTSVKNQLELDVLKPNTMTIFDLNGKQVFSTKLNYGIQSVDISNLNTSVYILRFASEDGRVSSKKIIKE